MLISKENCEQILENLLKINVKSKYDLWLMMDVSKVNQQQI